MCMAKKQKKEDLTSYGVYRSKRTPEEIKKLKLTRTVSTFAANGILAALIFIPQDSLTAISDMTWLTTLWVLFICALVIISVWASYQNFRGAKIAAELPMKNAPHKGFAKSTFSCFEWFLYSRGAHVVVQLALVIYRFDVLGLVSTILSAIAFAAAFISRKASFDAYKDSIFIAPESMILPELPEEAEDFYFDRDETEDGAAAVDVETGEETTAEDFYE